jgi:signal transduction histidine kinase
MAEVHRAHAPDSRPRLVIAGERSGADDRETGRVSELLTDAVLTGDVGATLCRLAEWWRDLSPVRVAAAGTIDLHRRLRTTALATAGQEVRHESQPVCVAETVPLRERLSQLLGCGDHCTWLPLTDGGIEVGGLLLGGEIVEPNCAEVLEVSARLLAAARRRDDVQWNARLESLAEFAAGAGHEINNPLGTILGRTQLLARNEADPERRRLLGSIGGQALRIRDMISDTMVFGRPPAPELTACRLSEVVSQVLGGFAKQLADRQVRLRCAPAASVPDEPLLHADPTQAKIVISELIRNSLEAMSTGGELQVVVARLEAPSEHWMELEIRDTGCGFGGVEPTKLMDPFYSGRSAGRGLGFGLSKCWRIVTLHGGCLHLVESPGGVTARAHWPIAEAQTRND